MSGIFKSVQVNSKCFNDAELQKFASLWNGNDSLSIDEMRMKWDDKMNGMKPMDFIKRLTYTIRCTKEHLKKLYRVDYHDSDVFDEKLIDTIRALERAYLSN